MDDDGIVVLLQDDKWLMSVADPERQYRSVCAEQYDMLKPPLQTLTVLLRFQARGLPTPSLPL
jgi:hypothetical protein